MFSWYSVLCGNLEGRVNYQSLCPVSTFHHSIRVHWPKTDVYAESLPIKRITHGTLFKLLFLFRLLWQPLQSMWELTKTTFWMRRRPLCRCHSSTFSGFLLTCFLKWSAVWCRSDHFFVCLFYFPFPASTYVHLIWLMRCLSVYYL